MAVRKRIRHRGDHDPESDAISKGGRPPIYSPTRTPATARNLAMLGAKVAQICEALGIAEATYHMWRTKFPAFKAALEAGKLAADGAVAGALFHRATGYTHTEEKIFSHPETRWTDGKVVRVRTKRHYPPDTAAALRWLAVRQPELGWDQPQKHEHGGIPGGQPIGMRDETKLEVINSILNLIKPKPDPDE
jgi:hypothetical protein